MRRTVLTSRSPPAPPAPAQATPPPPRGRWAQAAADPRLLWVAVLLLALLALAALLRPAAAPPLTQRDIDEAVRHTLSTQAMPSAVARAAEAIRPSVVRVVSYVRNRQGEEIEHGVGTGVVIVDSGVILTNLHVVRAAQRLRLVFADGTESGASITGVQARDDLAVLQAHTLPDDLQAATLRGTGGLAPGDGVVVVGFPFGIGPSTSAGVVSGLGRSFQSPDGEQELTQLIQFDAAANPGNSGGPLVTLDGEVVGIVTGILNPTPARTFAGIGFAVPIENAATAAGLPPF